MALGEGCLRREGHKNRAFMAVVSVLMEEAWECSLVRFLMEGAVYEGVNRSRSWPPALQSPGMWTINSHHLLITKVWYMSWESLPFLSFSFMVLCMNEWLLAVENRRKNSYFDKNTKGKKKIKQPAVFLNERVVRAAAASGRTRRIWMCFCGWEAESRIWIKLQGKLWANVYWPSVRTWVQIPGTYTKLVEAAIITGILEQDRRRREESPQEPEGRIAWAHYREQQDLPSLKQGDVGTHACIQIKWLRIDTFSFFWTH